MPISTSLVREIEDKRKSILNNPLFLLHRGKRIQYSHATQDMDAWLDERPHMKKRLAKARTREEHDRILKNIQTGVENLRQAWYCALQLPHVLTEHSVLKIGSKVDPTNNESYRRDDVALEHFSYSPPHPSRVRSSLVTSLSSINNIHCSVVEQAAMSHLCLIGIQPLSEGNKRTASIVQDRLLYNYHLPPVVIPAHERTHYFTLLETGLNDWKEKKSKGQRVFCDYIGEKVNETLGNIMVDMTAYSRHTSKSHK